MPSGGVQRIGVTIRGEYNPNIVQVRQGIPAEIEFDRQETGDCSSRVVFPACICQRPYPPISAPSSSSPRNR